MAEVQVFVEDPGPVQRRGDAGHLGDQAPLERRERAGSSSAASSGRATFSSSKPVSSATMR